MKVSVEQVTPQKAREWLANNPVNRPVRQAHVDALARDMERGDFSENGESIKFSGRTLKDGQHRLLAIIKADVTLPLVVVREVDDNAQLTIDRGSRRSVGNDLHLRGYKNANELAAAAALLWGLEHKNYPTASESLHLVETNPDLVESVREMGTQSRKFGMKRAVASVLHMMTMRLDQTDAEFFWGRLIDGVGLDADHPILQLRSQLMTDAMKSYGRMGRTRQWALGAKAWNLYRDGERVKNLIWRVGGAAPEQLPMPR